MYFVLPRCTSSVTWLLLQIADVIFPGLGIPEAAIRYVMIAVLVGFPIALVIGWMYELTPDGIVRTAPLSEFYLRFPIFHFVVLTTSFLALCCLSLSVLPTGL